MDIPILYKPLIALSYIALCVGLDAWIYGIQYERNRLNGRDWPFPARLLMPKVAPNMYVGNEAPYRIVQKIWEIGGAAAVCFILGSWIPALGFLIAHYMGTLERLYYLVLRQGSILKSYERNQSGFFHLTRWYQIGYFTLRKKFSEMTFSHMANIGFFVAVSLSVF